MLLAVYQGHLLPVSFLPAGGIVHRRDILAQPVPVRLVPVGDADHLPAVDPAHLLLGDDPVPHGEAPVVGPFLFNGQEVGGVMIFPDDRRIAQQQVRLEHIGVGQQIPRHHRGGNVVGFVVAGILQKADHGILVQQLVKLLRQVSPHDVDLLDPRPQAGVDQAVDDPGAVDADQGLGGVEGDGHHPGSESRRDEHRPPDPVGLQGVDALAGNLSSLHVFQVPQLLHDPVHRAQGMPRLFLQLALGQRFLRPRQNLQNIKLLSA